MKANGGTVWEYPDFEGTLQRGVFVDFSDLGGTDVTYKFQRLDADGKPMTYDHGGPIYDRVSGSRLQASRPVRDGESD